MKRTRCFFLSGVQSWMVYLRRWADHDCKGDWGYHNAQNLIGIVYDHPASQIFNTPALDDPRWPKECSCGYAFQPHDTFQMQKEQLFRRMDTGELITLPDAPPGAMWHADWMLEGVDPEKCGNSLRGLDGHSLVVRLPNRHDWLVDSRCSNCTMKEDNIHKCWPRHGEVPNITVDKNGNTCAAGAGSVMVDGWHGFLRNGWLEEC